MSPSSNLGRVKRRAAIRVDRSAQKEREQLECLQFGRSRTKMSRPYTTGKLWAVTVDTAPVALGAGQHSTEGSTKCADPSKKCIRVCVERDNEAPSQGECKRSDDGCERDVRIHGSVTTPSFGGMRTPYAEARAAKQAEVRT